MHQLGVVSQDREYEEIEPLGGYYTCSPKTAGKRMSRRKSCLRSLKETFILKDTMPTNVPTVRKSTQGRYLGSSPHQEDRR